MPFFDMYVLIGKNEAIIENPLGAIPLGVLNLLSEEVWILMCLKDFHYMFFFYPCTHSTV